MSAGTTLSQIVDNITRLADEVNPAEFIYEFLLCFGAPKSTIARLKSGALNGTKKEGCTLLKQKVYFEPVRKDLLGVLTPAEAMAAAKADKKIAAQKPRFLIVTDFNLVLALDTKKGEQTEFYMADLAENYAFFLPLAGMERTEFQAEAEADVKAAGHMAKLYDLIKADNPPATREDRHALNVFLTRLLFCYFAEDTGIFPGESLFTAAIDQCTQPDGSDVGSFLSDLFLHLNTDPRGARTKPKQHLVKFPYVNGGLFNDTLSSHCAVPRFTARSRRKLVELGKKSWKEINPDIFGSMFQGVVDDERRAEFGMHYTSVPNIMKVIRPLFLDELCEELEKAKGSYARLNKLLGRIYRMRFFDPACGSGNFLIIAYKELRRLEMAIFKELEKVENRTSILEEPQAGFDAAGFRPSVEQQTLTISQANLRLPGVHVNQFYGIELDDFARELAILSLWLAEHQMNLEFKAAFGTAPASLPLKDGARIVRENSLRIEWESVCPKESDREVVLMGNPPYLGSSLQDAAQKADMASVFRGIEDYKNLDYITGWFMNAARYLQGTKSRCAFVTTNSVCQGEQVALLWPHVFGLGIEIFFAHLSFKWTNNAKGQAGVSCVIIGLQQGPVQRKTLYSGGISKQVENINAYLVNYKNVFVYKRLRPLSSLRPMTKGSGPTDGGNLILSREQRAQLLEEHPDCAEIVRRLVGAEDYIEGTFRYCLWMSDEQAERFGEVPEIRRRIDGVREMRLKSKKPGTRQDAATPHRFSEPRHEEAPSIVLPRHSSENRVYIPFGYLGENDVVADSATAIYHAEPWLFGVVSSRMHLVWVRAVAGRLEERIRYSNTLCYNNFPFPEIGNTQRATLNRLAESVLMARENHPGKNLAWLYDPNTMPADLLAAHQALDEAVDRCYRSKGFDDDEERLKHLFALFEQMTEAD